MFEQITPMDFQSFLYMVVPGLIVVFMRSHFITGRSQKHSEAVFTYVSVSLVYWALISMTGFTMREINSNHYSAFFAVFFGPTMLGTVLGLNVRLDLLRNLIRKLRLNPVHATPTAWDWKFSRMPPQHVLVTLTSGAKVAGWYGSNSFSSSDPGERDLYIERIMEIPDEGPWQDVGEKGILIRPDEIRFVEFFPKTKESRSE